MASPNVHSFHDWDFEGEVLESDLPVLVAFTATWCEPCRRLVDIVDRLADRYQGEVKFGELDIDEERETAEKYGIKSVPVVLVFRGGQKAGQVNGFSSRTQVEIVNLLDRRIP